MPGAVAELIAREIQGTFRVVDRSNVAVPGAAPAARVVDNNPDRVSLLIVNAGPVDVEIGFTETLVLGQGIKLVNGGGFFSATWRDDFIAQTTPVFAIAAAAAGPLRIVEVNRDTGSSYPGAAAPVSP